MQHRPEGFLLSNDLKDRLKGMLSKFLLKELFKACLRKQRENLFKILLKDRYKNRQVKTYRPSLRTDQSISLFNLSANP